jgi:NCAIR mutase (PurE)-related protein
MKPKSVRDVLESIKQEKLSIDEGIELLRKLYYKDLGYAKIDDDREERLGYPEVIYCAGKTSTQILGIVKHMVSKGHNVLATHATEEIYKKVKRICSEAEFNALARTITIKFKEVKASEGYIAIVTAGTSDLPVAEEAFVTATMLGNRVEKIADVGVAGIHRLFDKIATIRGARVVIVVAGMEGALASVVGGLVDKPIIAVPTSVGYGASFGGIAALLSMLNSCASGVGVVNIDNGFGAGYLASVINKLK